MIVDNVREDKGHPIGDLLAWLKRTRRRARHPNTAHEHEQNGKQAKNTKHRSLTLATQVPRATWYFRGARDREAEEEAKQKPRVQSQPYHRSYATQMSPVARVVKTVGSFVGKSVGICIEFPVNVANVYAFASLSSCFDECPTTIEIGL